MNLNLKAHSGRSVPISRIWKRVPTFYFGFRVVSESGNSRSLAFKRQKRDKQIFTISLNQISQDAKYSEDAKDTNSVEDVKDAEYLKVKKDTKDVDDRKDANDAKYLKDVKETKDAK